MTAFVGIDWLWIIENETILEKLSHSKNFSKPTLYRITLSAD